MQKLHILLTVAALLTIFFLSSSSNLSLFAASSNAFGLENTLFGENIYYVHYADLPLLS